MPRIVKKITIFSVQIRGWGFIRAWAFNRDFTVQGFKVKGFLVLKKRISNIFFYHIWVLGHLRHVTQITEVNLHSSLSLMFCTNLALIDLVVLEKMWRPSWSCDLDHLYLHMEAPHEKFLLAKGFWRSSLKLVDSDG